MEKLLHKVFHHHHSPKRQNMEQQTEEQGEQQRLGEEEGGQQVIGTTTAAPPDLPQEAGVLGPTVLPIPPVAEVPMMTPEPEVGMVLPPLSFAAAVSEQSLEPMETPPTSPTQSEEGKLQEQQERERRVSFESEKQPEVEEPKQEELKKEEGEEVEEERREGEELKQKEVKVRYFEVEVPSMHLKKPETTSQLKHFERQGKIVPPQLEIERNEKGELPILRQEEEETEEESVAAPVEGELEKREQPREEVKVEEEVAAEQPETASELEHFRIEGEPVPAQLAIERDENGELPLLRREEEAGEEGHEHETGEKMSIGGREEVVVQAEAEIVPALLVIKSDETGEFPLPRREEVIGEETSVRGRAEGEQQAEREASKESPEEAREQPETAAETKQFEIEREIVPAQLEIERDDKGELPLMLRREESEEEEGREKAPEQPETASEMKHFEFEGEIVPAQLAIERDEKGELPLMFRREEGREEEKGREQPSILIQKKVDVIEEGQEQKREGREASEEEDREKAPVLPETASEMKHFECEGEIVPAQLEIERDDKGELPLMLRREEGQQQQQRAEREESEEEEEEGREKAPEQPETASEMKHFECEGEIVPAQLAIERDENGELPTIVHEQAEKPSKEERRRLEEESFAIETPVARPSIEEQQREREEVEKKAETAEEKEEAKIAAHSEEAETPEISELVAQLKLEKLNKEARDKKVVVVTQAATGIGFECVRQILEKHPDWVVYLCDRDEGAGRSAVEYLNNEKGLEARFWPLDIGLMASLRQFRDYLIDNHPNGIGVLINCVGFSGEPAFVGAEKLPAEEIVRRNYFATLSLGLELFPLLGDDARVVLVSSKFAQAAFSRTNDAIQLQLRACVKIEQVSELMELFIQNELSTMSVWLNDSPDTPLYKSYRLGDIYPFGVAKLGVNLLASCYQPQFDEEKASKHVHINACCAGLIKEFSPDGETTMQEAADSICRLALEQPKDSPIRGKFVVGNTVYGPLDVEILEKPLF